MVLHNALQWAAHYSHTSGCGAAMQSIWVLLAISVLGIITAMSLVRVQSGLFRSFIFIPLKVKHFLQSMWIAHVYFQSVFFLKAKKNWSLRIGLLWFSMRQLTVCLVKQVRAALWKTLQQWNLHIYSVQASHHYSQSVHVETLQPQGRNLRAWFGLDSSLYSLLTVRGLHPALWMVY